MAAQTAIQMAPAVGQTINVRFESLLIPCTVKDVKYTWGKNRILITPINGEGEQWIELDRCKLPSNALTVS